MGNLLFSPTIYKKTMDKIQELEQAIRMEVGSSTYDLIERLIEAKKEEAISD